MTVLELVIVLGIVAGATTMAALSVPKPVSGAPHPAERFSAFVMDSRLAAIRDGVPVLLTIKDGAAQAGERRIEWSPSELRLLVGRQMVRDYRVLVSPEGVIGGKQLSLEVGGVVTTVPGVYREAVR